MFNLHPTSLSSNVFRICYAVFEFLIALGLIILFLGYIILGRRRGNALKPLPFKTILVSMFFYFGAEICIGIYNVILIIPGVRLKATSPPAEPISEGLMLIAVNLLFYVFYKTISIFGEQIIGHIKLWPRLNRLHWVLLGIFVSISIVDFAWYIYLILSTMEYITGNALKNHYQTWSKIMSIKWILFWVGSWEILGALLFVGMQTSHAPYMRMSAYFALTASGFFFALNGLWAIWSINSYLAHVSPTQVAIAAREIIQFFFCMGSYLGLGLCAWRFPVKSNGDLEENDPPTPPTITKRSRGPVEADSQIPLAETFGTDASEASVSRPVAEVAASRPVLEADSNVTHEKP